MADTTDLGITTESGPLGGTAALLWDILAANTPRDLKWPTLLFMVTIATGIWLIRRGHGAKGADGRERPSGLIAFLLPRDIYTHVSARVDLWLWILERVLRPLWAAGAILSLGPATERAVIGALGAAFGEGPGLQPDYGWMLLYSLLIMLSYDFVFFLIHYTEHRLPVLWAIHQVHHSAEVLTPLTRYREHFLEGPVYAAGAALSYGFAAGVFAWLCATDITEATLLNIGFFSLLFGFNGVFRHYHVQFHYPRWLSMWLHSPVMHHVHHSYLPQHRDRNMAVFTSVWDRLFGTLYVPARDEYTPWGLGPQAQADCRSFRQNTLAPFRDWYRMLARKPPVGAETPAQR